MSLASSGLVTALLLAVVLGVLGVVWKAHMRGKIHKMTTTEVTPDSLPVVRPGGQDVVRMIRSEHAGEMTPEFSSALLLPGLGMAFLQATVSFPSHGPVPILLGTPEASLPDQLDPRTNAPRPGLLISPVSVRSQTGEGNQWDAPVELVMGRAAQQINSDFLPDGSTADATYAAAPPAGPDGRAIAPSGIETKISTMITSRGLDVLIAATNRTDLPRALTITWQAHFAAPASGLADMSVVPPETSAAVPVAPKPVPLGAHDVHEVFTGLKYSYLSQGPAAQLRNNADGYILHLTAMTPSIRSLRVDADKDGRDVVLAFSTAGGDTPELSRTIVAPHETLQWHVRVEATSDANYTAPAQ